MAQNMTSRLILELVDRVTAPARAVGDSILGLRRAANGAGGSLSDRLGDAIERNNASLDRARGRLIDAAAGFYTLRAAIGGPVRAAAAFESAMADVRKVVDFASEDHFAEFRDGLVALSRQVPYAVNDLAAIAAAAGQAGIAGDELVRFTEAAAKIGTAFDISADQAGEGLAKLMTGLGISLDEAIRLSDAMNHLSNSQASTAAEILDVVRRVGAQGQMFGFTAEQTAAFASAMIAAGSESEVAATSFRNMGRALTRGASATGRQRAAFKSLGLEAEDVATSMQRDAVATTVQVLEALSRIPKEQQAAIASDLFGDEARALGPLLTNLELVRSSVGLVADETAYAGSAFREFEVRNRTFEAAMQRFDNVLTALKITIGAALIPVLSDLMDRIVPVVDKVAEWVAANPALTAGVLAATAAVIGFKVAVAGLTFVGLLGRGGALSALALGMNTVGRAATGLRNAAGGMIALQAALAAMQGAQLGALGRIAAGARGIAFAVPGVALAAKGIAAIGAAIATISLPVWGAIAAVTGAIAGVGLTLWKNWQAIEAIFAGIGRALGEILAPALDAVRPALDALAPLGDTLSAGWRAAADALAGLGRAFGDLGDWLSSLLEQDQLTADQRAAWERAGYDLIMALWDGMKSVATSVTDWVTGFAARLIQPVKDAIDTIRSYIPGAGAADTGPAGFSEDFGMDGQRAKGGPISRGGRYLVGERGPELITASRSGYVNAAGRGGGPGPVVNLGGITINAAPGADAMQIGAEVRRQIETMTREGLRGIHADAGLAVY